MPWRSGQPGGRATRRAVAKANGASAESVCRMKLMEAEVRRCQGCHSYPMASAGTEATERGTDRAPGVLKAAILDSAAVKARKVRRTDRRIQ